MKTLRIILHDNSEIIYKTNKVTAFDAYEEWKEKLKNLGLDIEDFTKIDFVRLFDENGFVIDSFEYTKTMNCCICGEPIKNSGNNPDPYVRIANARCCDNCNTVHVIPLRIKLQGKNYNLYIKNGLESTLKELTKFQNSTEPLWKKLPRYKNFTEIEPTPFNILFKNKNYETVQLHSIEPLSPSSTDIIGFVGSISWINNKLTPLDGDSYYPEMLVYGYKETDEVLDILVDDW